MKARAALVLACLLSLGSLGCVSQPSLRLYGARVSHASPAGVGLTMTMAVHNDNSFDVMVRDVRADVVLANRYPMPTVWAQPNVWLPAGKSTLVALLLRPSG